MTASSTSKKLNFFRVFLTLLGITFLVLDFVFFAYQTQVLTRENLDADLRQNMTENRAYTFGLLFSADFLAVFLFPILVLNRPRLSNKAHHLICRIFFSLGLAVLVLYEPVAEMVMVSKSIDRMNERREAKGFEKSLIGFGELYMCGSKPDASNLAFDPEVYASHQAQSDEMLTDWNHCNAMRARSILSFFMALGVLIELGWAYKAGDLGAKGVETNPAGFVSHGEKRKEAAV